jgi:RNA ligase
MTDMESTMTSGESAGTHMHWPKFQNVHRHIKDGTIFGDVILTEKLDGSNLGIELDAAGLVALHGRNCLLWTKKRNSAGEDPFDRKYGSVRLTLHPLQAVLPKLQSLFNKIHNDEKGQENVASIIFYGEWYQRDLTTASWHPFGYRARQSAKGFQTMTLALHKTFRDYGLEPPHLLYFGGTIEDAVNALHKRMMSPGDARFEGVFVTPAMIASTNALGRCAKWKVSRYEEQANWILQGYSGTMVDQLHSVFHQSRPSLRTPKAPNHECYNMAELQSRIELALASVLSKSPATLQDMHAMKPQDRVKQVQHLREETLADLEEQYAAVGVFVVPKPMKKLVGKVVARQVMKK